MLTCINKRHLRSRGTRWKEKRLRSDIHCQSENLLVYVTYSVLAGNIGTRPSSWLLHVKRETKNRPFVIYCRAQFSFAGKIYPQNRYSRREIVSGGTWWVLAEFAYKWHDGGRLMARVSFAVTLKNIMLYKCRAFRFAANEGKHVLKRGTLFITSSIR